MAAHHNRFRKKNASPLSQEQILENEIERLKKDYDRASLTLDQEKQKLDTAQFIVEQAHRINILNQMNIVSSIGYSIQQMQTRRVQGHQAEIDRYRSVPNQILVFTSGFLGANMVPVQLSSHIREEQRHRDTPDEQERQQMYIWQHEQHKLEYLQRTPPPETPELRQARDKVRAIESQLLHLSRQIRDKEIKLDSIKAAPPAP